MPNILLLSENISFAEDLKSQIELYIPEMAVSMEAIEELNYDIFIIDEDINIAKEIIQNKAKAPVFLLTADKTDAIDLVGITVIYKPFLLTAYLEDIKSCINIYENSEDGFLSFNKYILRQVTKDILNTATNEEIKLTEKEVSIIKYLYKSANKIVTKNELLMEVWGYNPDATTHTVETHIYRLRQKIEQGNTDQQSILTSEGGYQLVL